MTESAENFQIRPNHSTIHSVIAPIQPTLFQYVFFAFERSKQSQRSERVSLVEGFIGSQDVASEWRAEQSKQCRLTHQRVGLTLRKPHQEDDRRISRFLWHRALVLDCMRD